MHESETPAVLGRAVGVRERHRKSTTNPPAPCEGRSTRTHKHKKGSTMRESIASFRSFNPAVGMWSFGSSPDASLSQRPSSPLRHFRPTGDSSFPKEAYRFEALLTCKLGSRRCVVHEHSIGAFLNRPAESRMVFTTEARRHAGEADRATDSVASFSVSP